MRSRQHARVHLVFQSGWTYHLCKREHAVLYRPAREPVQALFNAPDDQADYATRAVACAHALDQWAEAFRGARNRRGVGLGVPRIGVHAGPALVGDFGGGRFIDYTAYGDTINTASRLEAANKALGTRVCASDAVARGADNFLGDLSAKLVLRGRS